MLICERYGRMILIALNFIICLGAVTVIAAASILKSNEDMYLELEVVKAIAIPSLCLGAVAFINSLLGCSGVFFRRNATMLSVYTMVLMLIVILQCIFGIVACVYYIKMEPENDALIFFLTSRLFLHRNWNTTAENDRVAEFEREHLCCGVTGPEFYIADPDIEHIPLSCCESASRRRSNIRIKRSSPPEFQSQAERIQWLNDEIEASKRQIAFLRALCTLERPHIHRKGCIEPLAIFFAAVLQKVIIVVPISVAIEIVCIILAIYIGGHSEEPRDEPK